MAEKIFDPIDSRPSLLGLKIENLQTEVLKKLAPLDNLLKNPDRQMGYENNFNWSRSSVHSKIGSLAGNVKNHTTQKGHQRYKGLYLWVEKKTNNPVYVGISQHLDKRISDHATASGKSMATWAYMMAKDKHRDQFKELQAAFQSTPGVRKYDFVDREDFQSYIRDECYCLVLLESNDYLLYLMEVYAAIKYKTYWNLFHTH